MYWNYRLVKKQNEDYLFVTEVYYDENNNPTSWVDDEVGCYGETLEELTEVMQNMSTALDKPILYQVGNKLIEKN